MSIAVRADENPEVAWRRLVRELVSNGVFEELTKRQFYRSKGSLMRDKRRAVKKQKRKRSHAKRKAKK
ncbi:MAG: 30S ribosomal protein S21 [bacterium]